jgi:hypothetical protein
MMPRETETQAPTGGSENKLVTQAKTDLANRLSIAVDEIQLVEFKSVVWPDASLGCPQPGMAYAQVLTPGYLIILSAGGEDYEYHASTGTQVVHCEDPQPPVPGTPPNT